MEASRDVNDWLSALNAVGLQKTKKESSSSSVSAPVSTATTGTLSSSSSDTSDFNSFLQKQLQKIAPRTSVILPPPLVEYSDCESDNEDTEDNNSQCKDDNLCSESSDSYDRLV